MQPSQPCGSRPARRPLLVLVLLAFVISACGTPEGATPTVQPAAAQAATAAQPTSTPPPATVQPVPLTTPQPGQAAATPIPACTFNTPAGPEPQVPALEAYTFSEPKVILTGKSIGIADWLPDNKRLLIDNLPSERQQLSIDTLDIQTGLVQRYAERSVLRTRPIWLDLEQAVAFTAVGANNQVMLRIARGQGKAVEDVAPNLATPYLAANSDGHQMIFFSKASPSLPQVIDTSRGQRQVRPLTNQLISKLSTQGSESAIAASFRAAWQPDGSRIAFYNELNFYLADVSTGNFCEVDLGTDGESKYWAISARWSPDGRFLAIHTTIGASLPTQSADLRVLDTATGALNRIDLPVPFVYEAAWAPNSRRLLTLGRTDLTDKGRAILGLFIVNVSTGDFLQVLSEDTFSGGFYTYEGGALAWSPDGQKIAVKCPLWSETEPLITEDRLCLINARTLP